MPLPESRPSPSPTSTSSTSSASSAHSGAPPSTPSTGQKASKRSARLVQALNALEPIYPKKNAFASFVVDWLADRSDKGQSVRRSLLRKPPRGRGALAGIVRAIARVAEGEGVEESVAKAVVETAALVLSREMRRHLSDPSLQLHAAKASRRRIFGTDPLRSLLDRYRSFFPLLVHLLTTLASGPNNYRHRRTRNAAAGRDRREATPEEDQWVDLSDKDDDDGESSEEEDTRMRSDEELEEADAAGDEVASQARSEARSESGGEENAGLSSRPQTVTNGQSQLERQVPAVVLSTISQLLLTRNRQTNLFPAVFSLFLSSSGASKSTMAAMNRVGLGVSYDSTATMWAALAREAREAEAAMLASSLGSRIFVNSDNLDERADPDSRNEDLLRLRTLKHYAMSAIHVFPPWVPDEAFLPATQQEYARRQGSASGAGNGLLEENSLERHHWARVVEFWTLSSLINNLPSALSAPPALRSAYDARLSELRRLMPCSRRRDQWVTKRFSRAATECNLGSKSGVEAHIRETVKSLDLSHAKVTEERAPFWMTGDWGYSNLVTRAVETAEVEEDEPRRRLSNVHSTPQLWHLQLNLVYSIFRAFYEPGPSGNPSALHSHVLLSHRKGLNSSQPNFYEGLHHIELSLQARLLDYVRTTQGLSLVDFAKDAPPPSLQTLEKAATDTAAAFSFFTGVKRDEAEDEKDDILAHSMDFTFSALMLIEFRDAVRHADFGRIRALFKKPARFFKGSGAHNYASVLLELLVQEQELPEALLVAQEGCWLMNGSGREDGYYPVDEGLEHDNLTTKGIFRNSKGNAPLDAYTTSITGTLDIRSRIPSIINNALHLPTLHRTHRSIPAHNTVNLLLTSIYRAQLHQLTPSRTFYLPSTDTTTASSAAPTAEEAAQLAIAEEQRAIQAQVVASSRKKRAARDEEEEEEVEQAEEADEVEVKRRGKVQVYRSPYRLGHNLHFSKGKSGFRHWLAARKRRIDGKKRMSEATNILSSLAGLFSEGDDSLLPVEPSGDVDV
ncbi:hypothetical protein JCM6882_002050 [Rhodosporidiobolus microsporus]